MIRALFALALASVAGCRLTPPVATSVDAERGQVALAELQQGRQMMIRKCGNCHRPPMPGDHPAAAWPAKLDEMSIRAGLKRDQRHLIEQYLVLMSRR